MSSSSLVILLLRVAITNGLSAPLSATVGGSVLIPCSLPVNSMNLTWFYWQEDQSENVLFHWHTSGTEGSRVADEYRHRCKAFNAEFSHGNISIRLSNVSVGDDKKTFWTNVEFKEKPEKKPRQIKHQCEFTLRVSALYRDLVLTINSTAKRATCTAHGGYPEPRVSWTGRSNSSSAHLDLQDAQTSQQQDPIEKTFSVTSMVDVKDLHSVTCRIYNPIANQTIETKTDIPGEVQEVHWIISVIIILLLLSVAILFLSKMRTQPGETQPGNTHGDATENAPDASPKQSGGAVPNPTHEGSGLLGNPTWKEDAAANSDSKNGTTAVSAADEEEKTEKTIFRINKKKQKNKQTKNTENDKPK